MLEPESLSHMTQFGLAGLIALMWLTERRTAAAREKQLGDAHERILEQRIQLDALVNLVGENTRAVSALEVGQRAMSSLLQRLAESALRPPGPGT